MDQSFKLRYMAPECFASTPEALEQLEERLLEIGRLLNADSIEVSQPTWLKDTLLAGYGFDDYAVTLHLIHRQLTVESENSSAAIRTYLMFTGSSLDLQPTNGGDAHDQS